MKEFSELWDWVVKRTNHGVITVQERIELEHVFNLMKDCNCESYLEVGTAEGNSMYVLGQIPDKIHYIDIGEEHTKAPRTEVTTSLTKDGKNIGSFLGDSTDPETMPSKIIQEYDCVLIDGGHDFATVLSDAIMYAPLAKKYVFFHDIQLPEVRAAVEWFVKRWKLGKYSTFINSDTFGYGIIEVEQ